MDGGVLELVQVNGSGLLDEGWPIRLFRRSVLKQRKFKEISRFLGETAQMHCLDIGGDNGVISYLLRSRGGSWRSADLSDETVLAIRALVHDNVYKINGRWTPFEDNVFDRVVIVDFLEHIETDKEFVAELQRIIKPGGELIVNVPHAKHSLLRKFRLAIGQTDEKHGHVRPGYTLSSLHNLLADRFQIVSHRTYSRFFSEVLDTAITFALYRLKSDDGHSPKGMIVTAKDMAKYQKLFWAYSVIYPIGWVFAQLDKLLFWCSGYALIVKARPVVTEN
jgi:SAM-dependent methyltransferase